MPSSPSGALGRYDDALVAAKHARDYPPELGCRALLNDGDAAEADYRDAIDRLGRTRIRVELVRTKFALGELSRADFKVAVSLARGEADPATPPVANH